VEFLTGTVFALVAWHFLGANFNLSLGFSVLAPSFGCNPGVLHCSGSVYYFLFGVSVISYLKTLLYFVIFSLLTIIAVYDFRHQIIPNSWVYTFDALSLFALLFEGVSVGWRIVNGDLGWNFLAGIVLFLFFAAFWLFSKGKAMGFGDAKLALGIGWLLGWMNGVAAIVFSFWLGALVGIFLLIWKGKKYTMKSKIAFGPFIIFAAFLIFLWGGPIIDTVLKFLSFGSF